jgi:acyloxyacyl hydrolase
MLSSLVLVLFFAAAHAVPGLFSPEWFARAQLSSNGGGVGCIACSIVVGLLEQLSQLHGKTVDAILDDVCELFPVGAKQTCEFYVQQYGTLLVNLLASGLNPDEACHGLSLCTNPQCTLWPSSSSSSSHASLSPERVLQISRMAVPLLKQMRKVPAGFDPWQWIKDILARVIDHKAEVDLDGDGFSIIQVLRGSAFRGKDCNDLDAGTHPGKRTSAGDSGDRDCNGIFGTNPATGATWESELCDGVPHFGVISIGDSAGAHFEIDPAYMTAKLINNGTYRNLLDRAALEFDLPQYGGYTGHLNLTGVPTDSLYKFMRQQNRCVHRDYQNLCVNGMRSGPVAELIKTMARSNQTDHPALVFLELIGNDVCHPEHGFGAMTTPAEFRANIMVALRQLDSQLPRGSKVVSVALADGEVLYEWLHNRTHPIGVTYKAVYDYMNCLELAPCWGWQSSNATVRNTTQIIANSLSAMYDDIAAKETFVNFDFASSPFPLKQIVAAAKALGIEDWQLIEPIDGFHPGPYANALGARWQWSFLQKMHPSFVGQPNPHNAQIAKLFGDQGGY